MLRWRTVKIRKSASVSLKEQLETTEEAVFFTMQIVEQARKEGAQKLFQIVVRRSTSLRRVFTRLANFLCGARVMIGRERVAESRARGTAHTSSNCPSYFRANSSTSPRVCFLTFYGAACGCMSIKAMCKTGTVHKHVCPLKCFGKRLLSSAPSMWRNCSRCNARDHLTEVGHHKATCGTPMRQFTTSASRVLPFVAATHSNVAQCFFCSA